MSTQVWAIASGKGGTGKTFLTTSLGIILTKLNYNVLLIDLDTTGSNIHSHLGMPLTENNIRSFFNNEKTLQELVIETKIPKLFYIQGTWDSWSHLTPSPADIRKVISKAKNLKYDYIILDLGTGASGPVLEGFHQADERILITTPEPSCIERNYRFLETYLCYSIKDTENYDNIEKLHKHLKDFRKSNEKVLFSFRDYLRTHESVNIDFFERINRTPIRLITNLTRGRQDQDLGFSIKSVCVKYYDIQMTYLGYIDYDIAVWHGIKDNSPVLMQNPFTHLSGQFLAITKQLTSHNFQSNLYKEVI